MYCASFLRPSISPAGTRTPVMHGQAAVAPGEHARRQSLHDTAQLPEQSALAREDRPQHSRHGEDVLPVRYGRKNVFLDPIPLGEHARLVTARAVKRLDSPDRTCRRYHDASAFTSNQDLKMDQPAPGMKPRPDQKLALNMNLVSQHVLPGFSGICEGT